MVYASPAPKKQFGQNFLTSVPAIISIVQAGDIAPGDTILEVGPGKGALTDHLVATGASITSIEKDKDLIPLLEEKFSNAENLSLIVGDILTYVPSFTSYKVIANIPYYITGAILEHFLTLPNQPSKMVLLVQHEVATRICAREGKESILSLSIKCYGTPKLIKKVNRGSFFPAPTVDSAILLIDSISRIRFSSHAHEKAFFTLVKTGFSHKRKQLMGNLKETIPQLDWPTLFAKHGLNPQIRAEDLTLPIWLSLSLDVCSQL